MSRHGATDQDVVQSLWIGDQLPVMGQMAIQSFLQQGHPFHLYTYNKVRGVPDGAIVKPAQRILPASAIFRYREQGSYAGFSNYFRYKMLLLNGGWWADADVICLRPFRFDRTHVFSSEQHGGNTYMNATVIKAPAGCPAMADAVRTCASKESSELKWGDTGSKLITDLVARFGMLNDVEPPMTFCPVGYADWKILLDGENSAALDPAGYGLHLWNEMWHRADLCTDGDFDPRCLYQRLRERFLGQ